MAVCGRRRGPAGGAGCDPGQQAADVELAAVGRRRRSRSLGVGAPAVVVCRRSQGEVVTVESVWRGGASLVTHAALCRRVRQGGAGGCGTGAM